MSEDDLLAEYDAVVAKVDASVAGLAAKAGDQLTCARGCSQCCVEGLSVLTVEFASIGRYLQSHEVEPAPPAGGCLFLDDEGACTIYPARPLVCRTQGLAVRYREVPEVARHVRTLPVVGEGEVTACRLNYLERTPRPSEILEDETVQKLLLVVEQRFRARAGLEGPLARLPLSAFAE